MVPGRSAALVVVLGLAASCHSGSDSASAPATIVEALDEPPINATIVPSPEASLFDVDLDRVDWPGWSIRWPKEWRGSETIGSGWLIVLGPDSTLMVESEPDLGQDDETLLAEWQELVDLLDPAAVVTRSEVLERPDGLVRLAIEFRAPNEGNPIMGSIHALRSSDHVLTLILQTDPAEFARQNDNVERLLASVRATEE